MKKKKMQLKNYSLFLGRLENIVGIGENAGKQQFFLYPHSFQLYHAQIP